MHQPGQGFRPVDTEALGIRPAMADVDTTLAHPARVYDFLLGGKDNWPADREIGERLLHLVPNARDEAQANRAFLRRAVRYATSRGITQFLDIGTGIPAVGPTHETAHAVQPGAQIIYADNDPIVLAHARALLVEDDLTYVIQADVRDPDSILDHPQTRQRLDFTRPVALMFVGLLYFVTDAELNGLIERYTGVLAPGSVMILTHALDTPQAKAAKEVYKASAPLVPRGRDKIAGLFTGLDLTVPGLVPIHEWRPDDEGSPPATHLLGGVAVKP